MAGLAPTVLLYPAGEPDVMRIVHPGARPAVKSKLERAATRTASRTCATQATTQSARNSAALIEHREIEHGQDAGMARTIRSHMRGGALASVLDGRRPGHSAGAVSPVGHDRMLRRAEDGLRGSQRSTVRPTAAA